MATLGSGFPPQERRKSVRRRLQPGAVIYLDVVFPDRVRPKYLVVGHVTDEECRTFIVNSRVHPFIARRRELSVCQVRMDAARHAFLSKDSFIACHEVLRLPTQVLLRDLMEDMSRIKGEVHAEVRAEIAAAVKRAPTLSPAEQAAIAQALERTDTA